MKGIVTIVTILVMGLMMVSTANAHWPDTSPYPRGGYDYGYGYGYGGDTQIDKINGYLYLVERCLGIFPQAAGALKSTEAIWKIPTQPQPYPQPQYRPYPDTSPYPQPQYQQPQY